MNITTENTGLELITAGTETTIQGIVEISEGNVIDGIKAASAGLFAIDLSTQALGIKNGITHHLALCSLGAGLGAVGSNGLTKTLSRKVSWAHRTKGAVQAIAAGALGLMIIRKLDPQIAITANRAFVLGYTGCSISRQGINNFANGHHIKGTLQLALGLSGIAGACYHLFHECVKQGYLLETEMPNDLEALIQENEANHSELLIRDTDTDELEELIQNHHQEIMALYRDQKTGDETGDWEFLGHGHSKVAFSLPRSPYIVKIPKKNTSIWNHNDNDAHRHFDNLQFAKKIIDEHKFTHLFLPKSYLIETPLGPMNIEEKLNLIAGDYFNCNTKLKDEAILQLERFQHITGICDLAPEDARNSGFIEGSESNPKIGIIDVDCNSRRTAYHLQFDYILETTNTITTLFLATIAAALFYITKIPRDPIASQTATIAILCILFLADMENNPLENMIELGVASASIAFIALGLSLLFKTISRQTT